MNCNNYQHIKSCEDIKPECNSTCRIFAKACLAKKIREQTGDLSINRHSICSHLNKENNKNCHHKN
jgi:hypothetical protein